MQTDGNGNLASTDVQQTPLFAAEEHRLKTTLAVISGWASTLEDRWDALTPEQQRDGVATIRRNAETLANQTHRLLEDVRAQVPQ